MSFRERRESLPASDIRIIEHSREVIRRSYELLAESRARVGVSPGSRATREGHRERGGQANQPIEAMDRNGG